MERFVRISSVGIILLWYYLISKVLFQVQVSCVGFVSTPFFISKDHKLCKKKDSCQQTHRQWQVSIPGPNVYLQFAMYFKLNRTVFYCFLNWISGSVVYPASI